MYTAISKLLSNFGQTLRVWPSYPNLNLRRFKQSLTMIVNSLLLMTFCSLIKSKNQRKCLFMQKVMGLLWERSALAWIIESNPFYLHMRLLWQNGSVCCKTHQNLTKNSWMQEKIQDISNDVGQFWGNVRRSLWWKWQTSRSTRS